MSEPTIFRPIWTPEDARQTARDAANHRGIPGKALTAEDMEPDVPLPFRRNVKAICPCCSAWPLEVCEPGCLSMMTAEEQHQHRQDVLDATLAELGLLDEFAAPVLVTECRIGRHRAPTSARLGRIVRSVVAVLALALVLTVGGFWLATRAEAVPPNCKQEFWLIAFQSNTRTICDGPIAPDGSWVRIREFWSPAYRVPLRTSCYGTYSLSCTTTGGYVQPMTSQGIEQYIVFPHNVLPDEPGHLG